MFAVALCFATILPESATANPLGTTLCSVVEWFTHGSVGVGLAAISIFVTAIAAALNKISWGMFIFASLDIALIFGAAGLVVELGGLDSCYPY